MHSRRVHKNVEWNIDHDPKNKQGQKKSDEEEKATVLGSGASMCLGIGYTLD